MAFMTDRKRATGLGSARDGTNRHWTTTLSAMGLLVLVPLFVFTFGVMLGRSHEDVTAYFARPFPAIVAILTLWVGFMHFKNGARVVIEDYVHGYAREFLIVAVTGLSYAAAATGVFAVLKMAL